MLFLEKLFHYRFARFAFCGGLATLTHIGISFALLAFYNTHILTANIIGFIFAFILSYTLQSYVVFKKDFSFKNAIRFFTVQFTALLISQSISQLFQETNNYLRIIIIVFMIPFITYFIHQIWTYKETLQD